MTCSERGSNIDLDRGSDCSIVPFADAPGRTAMGVLADGAAIAMICIKRSAELNRSANMGNAQYCWCRAFVAARTSQLGQTHLALRGPELKLIDHEHQLLEDWRPGVRTRMRISAQTGAKELTIFEQWCAPGHGAPTHWHPVEEVLSVLSGKVEIWIGDQRLLASAGQSALIPAKRRHGFRNSGESELHILAILAAPLFEAHYDDSGVVARRWEAG